MWFDVYPEGIPIDQASKKQQEKVMKDYNKPLTRQQVKALQKKQKARETQQRSEKLDRKIGALLAKHGQRPQE